MCQVLAALQEAEQMTTHRTCYMIGVLQGKCSRETMLENIMARVCMGGNR